MNGNSTTPSFQSALQVKPAVFEVMQSKVPVAERHESDRASSIIMTEAESRNVEWSTASFPVVGEPVNSPNETLQSRGVEPTPQDALDNTAAHEQAPEENVVQEGPCPLCEETEARTALQLEAMEAKMGGPIQESVERLDEALFTMSRQMHLDVVTLATQMASAILKREVELDSEVLLRNVEQALKTAGTIQSATIHCHPDDVALLEARMTQLRGAASPRLMELSVEGDEEIMRGGCRVRFPEGSVDARLDAQLTHVSEAVRATLLGPRSTEGEDA